jgi:dCTP deaminase
MKSTTYKEYWLLLCAKYIITCTILGTIALLLIACINNCNLWLNMLLGTILGAITGTGIAYYKSFVSVGDLTDWQIALLGPKLIENFNPEQVEPDSYDVLLGDQFSKIESDGSLTRWTTDKVILEPGEAILGHTIENFTLPENIKGTLQGKSTWARYGIFIEAAGLFDKGFSGTAVLEIFNSSAARIILKKGEKIGQMSFQRTENAAQKYGSHQRNSHYQGQQGAQEGWVNPKLRIAEKTETAKRN